MTGTSLLNRARASGALLMLLGAWGAIIPFAGPYFGYAYTPDKAWAYTSGRLWLSVAPGAAAFIGGILILISAKSTAVGAILAALGGAWFALGQMIAPLAPATSSITPGQPVVSSGALFGAATMRFLEGLGFYYGLGLVVVFLAALALGKAARGRTEVLNFGAQAAGPAEYADDYGTPY